MWSRAQRIPWHYGSHDADDDDDDNDTWTAASSAIFAVKDAARRLDADDDRCLLAASGLSSRTRRSTQATASATRLVVWT